MAITYHAGRRIQGLERVGSTLTDVDSPWTFANAQGSVSSGAVSFDYNQSTTDRGYHDLGANASGTWVFRFRLNITNKGNPSASNYLCKFGLGDNTNATSTSQGGIFFTLNHGSSYTRFGGFSSYNQIYQAGNWGSNSSTYGYSTSTNYYVEVARTGTTTATVKVFTNANYTDGLVFTNTLSSVDASLNVRYVKITTDPYGDQGSNRYNGTMDQMKFYDGVTSVVAIAGDVKPTNVQVGSRFEETDTRKMYSKLPITSLSLTGLKSYYTFNEASGTLVNSATTIGSSDSLGTASDSASTSNITYAQTGKIGDAISFNGTTSSSRVDIGSSLSQFNFLHEVNATASFNFWYKKTAVDTNFRTIWAQHYGTGGQRGVRLGFTGTRGIQFLIYNNTGSTTLGDSTSGFTANDTDWHMFTLTWDLSLATNTLQVYHDGVLDHQANRTTSGENGNSGLVPSLGDDKGGDGNWYGLLDEMSVWDRVLSANDVTLLYNSGSGTTPDNAEGGGWKEKGTT